MHQKPQTCKSRGLEIGEGIENVSSYSRIRLAGSRTLVPIGVSTRIRMGESRQTRCQSVRSGSAMIESFMPWPGLPQHLSLEGERAGWLDGTARGVHDPVELGEEAQL